MSNNNLFQTTTYQFVEAGNVHELYLYPIKSCKPNKVDWIDCTKRGASKGEEFDRHFLLVDSLHDNLFLTARIYPKMVLVEVHVFNGKLIIKLGSNDKIVEVDLKEVRARGEIRRARSWPASQQRQMPFLSSKEPPQEILSPSPYSLFADTRTEGFDCGDEIGQAFDEFLEVGDKRKLRLIWFGDAEILYTERDAHSKSDYWLNNDVPELQDNVIKLCCTWIAYHDLASFMAFSLESITDLNRYLKNKGVCVDSRYFRPTLVISGLPPFDEDSWLRVKAGDAEFICYKPCTRCILTTDSPVFGVNMAIVKPGRVRVGDPVYLNNEKKFVEAGNVHELYLYPIKSCKPNKVDWIDCTKRGGSNGEEFDRHFLLVDSLRDNLLLTARIYPKMVLVETHVFNGKLIIKLGSNNKIVEADLKEIRAKGEIRRARLWEDARTEGFDCGDEIAQGFDEFLEVGDKRKLRLGMRKYYLQKEKLNQKIAFHDLASFMAFSLESVTDINKHLKNKGVCVDSRNFRPNLVISGLPPFDEDSWLRVKAGDAEFICYKPCTRYRLAPGKLYEIYKDSPVFGVNMAIVKPGRVRVGDPVWIQYKSKPF
uniref:MOSC domain-containing protein n=1 Tax=Meloidogyne hapla TaxID=6305 RepID=A0A1I8B4I3_MELHA